MRRLFVWLIALVGVSSTQRLYSQQGPHQTLSSLRPRLEDADWREREDAYRLLKRLEADAPTLVVPEYFRLLHRENSFILIARRREERLDERYGDPYYSDVVASSWRGYKVSPKSEWYRELVQSSYNLQSALGMFLRDEASRHLDLLGPIADNHEDEYVRLNATGLLAYVLQTGKSDKEGRKSILELLGRRLDDPYPGVRAATIEFLRSIGGAEAHRLLVASRSRGVRSPSEIQRLESAIRAIGSPE